MIGLSADLKHALRLCGRTPFSSAISVIVLGIGIAFVSAFLSLYVDLVLKPYPGIEKSGRLVTLVQTGGRWTRFSEIERMAREVNALEAVVGLHTTSVFRVANQGGSNVVVGSASQGFFDGIKPRLVLGRGFELVEHDSNAEPVGVITCRYWQEQYDGRPDVLGETIELSLEAIDGQDPTEFRVIGVLAPDLQGLMSDDVRFWVPFERIFPLLVSSGAGYSNDRGRFSMWTLARLRPGVTVEALRSELGAARNAELATQDVVRSIPIAAVKGVVPDTGRYSDTERQLRLFLIGSILVALVAAADVSLYLLTRAPARQREVTIRLSVGAQLWRLARQLAIEAGLLVVVAAVLGMLFGVWLADFLSGMSFLRSADWRNVTLLDWRVLGLVSCFLLVLTISISLAPIMGLKRLGSTRIGRQVAARATAVQWAAGNLQIAATGALGGAAIAFAWVLGTTVLGGTGYAIEDRHSVTFTSGNAASFDASNADLARNREIIESLPGVRAVTLGNLVPGVTDELEMIQVSDPDNPFQTIAVSRYPIDAEFVDVLALTFLYGRSPSENEECVSLVNRSFARRYFGRDDVVGEVIDTGFCESESIVGVLEDVSFGHPSAPVEPLILTKVPFSSTRFLGIIDSPLPSNELRRQLNDLFESGEFEYRPSVVRTLGDIRNSRIAPDRARGILTIVAASVAAIMAALGLYGTQHYLVNMGRREYAIRAALGAGPRALGRLVFVRAFRPGLPGLVVGALLAFVSVAWLSGDILPRDTSPGAIMVVVVIELLLLLLIASLGPARVARSTQPAPLLQEDY